MLTYDSLVEQAKIGGMPPAKTRGILREYLQVLILKGLYKNEEGKRFYFTGGTYLRLVCGLKRFSEDLDFDVKNITRKEFEKLQKEIKVELKRIGLETQIEFSYRENLYVSNLLFPEVEKTYNVVSKYSKKEGIIIKVELNKTEWKIKTETQVISGFGEFYPCICTEKGTLFANKIDALNKKTRGRHLYDIMFMLSNKYPISGDVLKNLGLNKDPLEMISDRVKDLTKEELSKQAETLRPFLFEESEANMLVNAHEIIPLLIEKYRKK